MQNSLNNAMRTSGIFFRDALLASNSRFALTSRLPRVFLAFASLLSLPPKIPKKIMPIVQNRGILVYNICLISINILVSDGATNKSVLNIERSY